MALAAAVLHAGWNLVAKRSATPFVALWGQFAVAAVIGVVVLARRRRRPRRPVGATPPSTGAIHVPYLAGLALAYERGDFSLAYPIARGGGALLAAIGGIVLLGDELDAVSITAILTVVAGMMLLAVGAAGRPGGHGRVRGDDDRRLHDQRQPRRPRARRNVYPFAVFTASGVMVSVYAVVTGRLGEMRTALPVHWRGLHDHRRHGDRHLRARAPRRPAGSGRLRRRARESSVVIAALVGTRYLSETGARRRTIGATIVVAGLVLLVASA